VREIYAGRQPGGALEDSLALRSGVPNPLARQQCRLRCRKPLLTGLLCTTPARPRADLVGRSHRKPPCWWRPKLWPHRPRPLPSPPPAAKDAIPFALRGTSTWPTLHGQPAHPCQRVRLGRCCHAAGRQAGSAPACDPTRWCRRGEWPWAPPGGRGLRGPGLRHGQPPRPDETQPGSFNQERRGGLDFPRAARAMLDPPRILRPSGPWAACHQAGINRERLITADHLDTALGDRPPDRPFRPG